LRALREEDEVGDQLALDPSESLPLEPDRVQVDGAVVAGARPLAARRLRVALDPERAVARALGEEVEADEARRLDVQLADVGVLDPQERERLGHAEPLLARTRSRGSELRLRARGGLDTDL